MMPSQDICFCTDADQCPAKDNCRRTEKPKDQEYVSYSDFYAFNVMPASSGACAYFMQRSK